MTSIVPQSILDGLTDVPMPRLANERPPKAFVRVRLSPAGAPGRSVGAGQRRGRASGRRRARTPQRGRGHREPERVRRNVGLLRIRQADPAHRQHRGARRRLPGSGRGARRRGRHGRGHRLRGGGRIRPRALVPAVHGAADPAGPARRRPALSDRPRRGRPRHQLRSPDLSPHGPGVDPGSDPPRHPDLQSHDSRSASRCARTAAPRGRRPRHGAEKAKQGQSVRIRRLSLRHGGHRHGRSGRALPRQRLSAALLRVPRSRAGSGNRRGQSHRKPVRHRDAAGQFSLEPVRAPTCSACRTSSRATRAGTSAISSPTITAPRRRLASNIFRKGYQWPFHATRMLDFGSSLLDLAVTRETQAGRKVFMDFNRNPLPFPETRSSVSTVSMTTSGATSQTPGRCSKRRSNVCAR